MPEVTAGDVKASLEVLDQKLEDAQKYTKGYALAPKYVSHTTRYLQYQLGSLRYTLDKLREKIPDKFQSERGIK